MRTRAWPSIAAVVAMAASMVVLGPAAPTVSAAQGDLDETFAAAGLARTNMSGQFTEANATAVQPDGKIVAVGTVGPAENPGSSSDLAVVRYNPDGSLDDTFGAGGVRIVDVFGDRDEARGVAVQPDGKIVVVGVTAGYTATVDALVLRLTQDGQLDPEFGDGGVVTLDSGDDDEANAVAIRSTGNLKILVGGSIGGGYTVLRFDETGFLDETFDNDGRAHPGSSGITVAALTLDSQNRIVAVGPAANQNIMAFRLTDTDGSLDTTFGEVGATPPEPSSGFVDEDLGFDDDAFAVTLSASGKILIAGRARSEGDLLVLLRFESDGQALDDTFADGGVILTDLSRGSAAASAVLAVGDGSHTLVAGTAGSDMVLARYDDSGQPVAGFGDNGVVVTDSGSEDEGRALAAVPGGQFVAAGTVESTALGRDIAVYRYGDDGTPDSTFGTGGRVMTDVSTPGDELTAMVVDPGDGRITAAGYSGTGLGWDFVLARYDAFGNPDPTFGDEGKVALDVSPRGDDRAYGLAFSINDTVTVVGDSNDGIAVLRIQPDGTPDPSFGTDGRFVYSADSGPVHARAVAVDLDGRTVVAGFTDDAVVLLRLDEFGFLDPSFGEDGTGVVMTPVDSSPQAHAIALEPGGLGDIIVAGDVAPQVPSFFGQGIGAQFEGDRDFLVMRYNNDGGLVAGFGQDEDGVAVWDMGGHDEARAVGLLTDGSGKIMVGGRTFLDCCEGGSGFSRGMAAALAEPGASSDIALLRLRPDGAPDDGLGNPQEEFGTFGRVIDDIGDRDSVNSLVVLPTDDVLVAGASGVTGVDFDDTDFTVVAYDGLGNRGTAFGENGVATAEFGGNDEARVIAQTPDEGFVVAGSTRSTGHTDFAFAGLGPLGEVDPDFGIGGRVSHQIVGDQDEARGVAVQPDGKILVIGEAYRGPAGDFAVARYNADGTLDETFGEFGRTIVDLSGAADGAYAIALKLVDGELSQIIVAGDAARGPASDFAFLALTPDGQADDSFGGTPSSGMTTYNFAFEDHLRALLIQPDGAIVGAGYAISPESGSIPGAHDFALVRLDAGGTVDPTFGSDGQQRTDIFGGRDEAYGVALQPGGRIIAAGHMDGGAQLVMVAYDADGVQDVSFGTDGFITEPLASARAVAVQPDGKIVLAGDAQDSPEGSRHAFARRYEVDGDPDPSFGQVGGSVPGLGPDSHASAVAIQPDGGIVVAADLPAGELRDLAAVRLRPDGVGDPRFGEDGVALAGLGGTSPWASRAVVVQPNGNIVMVGTDGFEGFAVLRFIGGDTGPVGPPTDLGIVVVADTELDSPRVGQPLRYGITVVNLGPSTATAVTVRDVLPAGVLLLATSGSQGEPCTSDGAELICPVGTIQVGAAAGLTITVQPTAAGEITNTARASGDQADPNQSNDIASVTTTVLPPASIRINPGVIALGRAVKVIGADFTPGTSVAIGFPGFAPITTTTVGPQGSFAASLVIFKETVGGKRIVEARSTSDPPVVLATANLLIVSETLSPPAFVVRN